MSNNQKGFTLIEMLVVMSIVIIMTVFVIVDYRTGQRKYELTQAAQRLVSDIRKAQSLSVSGVDLSGSLDRYGYGIYIVEGDSSYLLYVDKQGNRQYNSGTDEIVETVDLPQTIEILDVSTGAWTDVFYEPPHPITYIRPGNPSSANIVLRIKNSSDSKTITITDSGLVQSN